jgi:hypothetical protein
LMGCCHVVLLAGSKGSLLYHEVLAGEK